MVLKVGDHEDGVAGCVDSNGDGADKDDDCSGYCFGGGGSSDCIDLESYGL